MLSRTPGKNEGHFDDLLVLSRTLGKNEGHFDGLLVLSQTLRDGSELTLWQPTRAIADAVDKGQLHCDGRLVFLGTLTIVLSRT